MNAAAKACCVAAGLCTGGETTVMGGEISPTAELELLEMSPSSRWRDLAESEAVSFAASVSLPCDSVASRPCELFWDLACLGAIRRDGAAPLCTLSDGRRSAEQYE